MPEIEFIVTIALFTAVSLISGLFFTFSIAVIPGLKHLTDQELLKTMKNINKEILNPLFLSCFFGPFLLFPPIIYLQSANILNLWLLIMGFVFYLSVILITISINVPLNNRLAFSLIQKASRAENLKMRHLFENKWAFWNNIRTVLSVISLILLCVSQLDSGN